MEGAGCFYFTWKRLLKFIFYSCHKVSALVVEGRAEAGNDVTTIEEVVNVQEKACVIVRRYEKLISEKSWVFIDA